MSNVQAKAAETSAEVESVTNAVLIAFVALDQADAATGSEIKKRIDEIDMTDTGSIIGFGSAAQEELQVISQSMLQGVKNKDVGPAGNSLRDMVTTIRGFSVSELDLNRKQSWWEKLIGSRRTNCKIHRPIRRGAIPNRQDHRGSFEPRNRVVKGYQIA